MATPFLSEIMLCSYNFAPKGWALCNGQTLPINQNQALFSLLGTTYGGNGQTTFGLPDLRGRVAMHMGNGHILGERGGEENHTLISTEMPAHIHVAAADSSTGSTFAPSTHLFADAAPLQAYSSGSGNMVAMSPSMVTSTGGSQPHNNMQPYLVISYCIALQGVFPSPV